MKAHTLCEDCTNQEMYFYFISQFCVYRHYYVGFVGCYELAFVVVVVVVTKLKIHAVERTRVSVSAEGGLCFVEVVSTSVSREGC
jgi:hypothetical protein